MILSSYHLSSLRYLNFIKINMCEIFVANIFNQLIRVFSKNNDVQTFISRLKSKLNFEFNQNQLFGDFACRTLKIFKNIKISEKLLNVTKRPKFWVGILSLIILCLNGCCGLIDVLFYSLIDQ